MPDDAKLGMVWWNRLPEPERAYWAREAGNTGVAADAWAAFKKAAPSVRQSIAARFAPAKRTPLPPRA